MRVQLKKSLMNFVIIHLFIVVIIFLPSCGEIKKTSLSKEQVLAICSDEKKKAMAPEAELNLSKSKNGNAFGFSLSFSSNFIKGANPETVYTECINRLST